MKQVRMHSSYLKTFSTTKYNLGKRYDSRVYAPSIVHLTTVHFKCTTWEVEHRILHVVEVSYVSTELCKI